MKSDLLPGLALNGDLHVNPVFEKSHVTPPARIHVSAFEVMSVDSSTATKQ
jgi:hypothetical protein